MATSKEELSSAWNLLLQLEKVTQLLWRRYTTEFMEMDQAEVERKQRIESDTTAQDEWPF